MLTVFFAHLWIQERFFAPEVDQKKATPTSEPLTERPGPDPGKPSAPAAKPVTTEPQESKSSTSKAIKPEEPAGKPPQTTAAVDGPLYRAVVSSEGGKLQEWVLRYRGDRPMIELGEQGPRGLLVGQDGAEGPLAMALKPQAIALEPAHPSGDLVLTGEAYGLRIRETLRFQVDTFTVETDLRIENLGAAPRTLTVTLPWMVSVDSKQPPEKFLGQRPTEVVWATRDHVERVESLTAVGQHELEGRWVALGSKWYLAALMPKSGGFKILVTGGGKQADAEDGQVRVAIAVRATPTVAPAQVWEGRVLTYVGPKEYDRLAAHGLEQTVNFGGFLIPQSWTGGRPLLPMAWLGVPVLKLMNWLHGFVPNYGIVIIMLTVVSKVLFYPLTVKSMRSMKAMQALQPHINSLRNKYRSDPRKLQEETLALYRKHNVNPMGGCLPMVAQVPIFYALYLALDVSVELQNAAFLCFGEVFGIALWICDLSRHDPTYVLPVLMGVSMFVQQRMSPTVGDPRQAKMMLIMPFIFTFMFLNLPSGLVLYWFVSNVLQILQQWWMDRPRRMSEAKDAARA